MLQLKAIVELYQEYVTLVAQLKARAKDEGRFLYETYNVFRQAFLSFN